MRKTFVFMLMVLLIAIPLVEAKNARAGGNGNGGGGAPAKACSDGADNDGDGLADYPDDPGCSSTKDNDEYNAPPASPACGDGVDNDGDAKADYPADPGCTSPSDNDEYNAPPPEPACSDGIDNDGDGKADYPADPGCRTWFDGDEYSPCIGVAEVCLRECGDYDDACRLAATFIEWSTETLVPAAQACAGQAVGCATGLATWAVEEAKDPSPVLFCDPYSLGLGSNGDWSCYWVDVGPTGVAVRLNGFSEDSGYYDCSYSVRTDGSITNRCSP